MRGRAVANGAVSLVNAIASGRGATVSVGLRTEATVEVVEGKGRWEVTLNGKPSESPLIVGTVDRAARACKISAGGCHGFAETKTTIPVGVGLKSSSSASVAVAMAVFDAAGSRDVRDDVILGCSVGASLASGTSITGALDDAASCLLGGVNLADNANSSVLFSGRLPKKMDVLIRVPAETSRRSLLDLAQARKLARVVDSLLELCRRGDYWAAMTLNGLLYSGLLGYEPDAAVNAMKLGARGAGLSGTGPSVAAVFESHQASAIKVLAEAWSEDGAAVISTSTNNKKARFLG